MNCVNSWEPSRLPDILSYILTQIKIKTVSVCVFVSRELSMNRVNGRGSIPCRHSYFCHLIQTGPWVCPASYPMRAGGTAHHSPSFSAQVRHLSGWSCCSRLVFGRCLFWISVETPAALREGFRSFCQSLLTSAWMSSRLGNDHFLLNHLQFIIHQLFYHSAL
jgi:hypothetical protein